MWEVQILKAGGVVYWLYDLSRHLLSILTRLTNLSSKKVSKKDKKEAHSIFRDTLDTVKNYSKRDTRLEIYKKSEEGLEILNNTMGSNYIKLERINKRRHT